MRSARTSRSAGRTLSSIGSETDDNGTGTRQDSLHSSQTDSFLDREPVFESGGSSDSESDFEPTKAARQPVSVVWQNISVVSCHRKLSSDEIAETRTSQTEQFSSENACLKGFYTSKAVSLRAKCMQKPKSPARGA